jgi:PAS domain S-box-containing protein
MSENYSFSFLFNNLPEGLVIQDENGQILEANVHAENLLGLTVDQMAGRTSVDPRWRAVKSDGSDFPGEEHPAMITLKTGKPIQNCIMGVYHPKNENWVWININTFPEFLQENESPKRVYSLFTDITEKREAEEKILTTNKQLHEKSQLLESLLNSQSNYFVRIDLKGNYIFANSNYQEKFQFLYTNGQFIGQPVLNSVMEYDHSKLYDTVNGCLKNPGKIFQITLDKPKSETEIGTSFWEFVAISNKEGKVEGIQCIGIDITEFKNSQRELQEAEEKYQSLVDSADVLTVLIDQAGIILYANKKTRTLLAQNSGSDGQPINIKSFYANKIDVETFEKDLSKLFETGEPYSKEISLFLDNKIIWVKGTASPVIDENKKVYAAHITALDVSELREKEELLRLSEQRYKELIEATDALVVVLDEDGKYVLLNEKAAVFSGTKPSDFTGKTLWDMHDQKEADSIKTGIDKVLRERNGFVSERCIHVNGKELWFRTSFQPLNNFLSLKNCVLITSSDITERKIAEKNLKESEEKHRSLVESSDSVIATFNLDGTCTFANAIALRLVGLQPGDALANNFKLQHIFPSNRIQTVQKDIQQIVSTKEGINENVELTVGGINRHFKSSMQPIFDLSGNVSSILLNATEITDLKKVEEQLRISEDNYRNLFDESPQAILVIQDGIYIDCNKASLKLIAGSRNDIIGKTPPDISPKKQACGEDSITLAKRYIAKTNAEGQASFEWNHIKSNGDDFLAEINLYRSFYFGKSAILVFWKDITLEKENLKKINLLSQIVDQSPTSIILTNLEGNIEYINKAVEDNLGYSSNELIGKNPRIWKSDNTDLHHYEDFWNTLLNGKTWRGEFTNIRKNGEIIIESSTAFPIYNRDGVLTNLVAIQENITDRKQTEEELKLFKTIFEKSVTGQIITRPDGTIVYHNPNFAKQIQYEKEEIDNCNYETFISTVSSANFKLIQKKVLKTKNAASTELEQVRKNGEKFPVLMSINCIFDEHDSIQYLAIGVNDISERKMIENEIIELNLNLEIKVRNRTNELQIANNQLNTFFEASIDLLCIASQDGFLRKVSRSFEHTLGYEIDELIDQRFLDFVHPDDLNDTLKAMGHLNEQQPVFRFVNRYRTKQGDFKYIEWYSSPVGEFVYSVARDVTESLEQQRKLIEAREIAETSNAQKSHFLSRMSHELRTPMNSILGFAQLLEMTELSEMQESSTKHILKSGKNLLELINEVLEISRIESGNISLSLEPINLTPLLKEVCDLLRPLAQKNEVTILLDESLSQELYINSDLQRSKQIITNLVSNAIKYNKPGGFVQISQEKITNSNGEQMIRFAIKDSGIGILESDFNKLFEPFQRIHAENSGIEGTGLGLSVVKELITVLRGKIEVTSELGVGSTFYVELPHAESSEINVNVAFDQLSPAYSDTDKVDSYHILYIEDNPSNISLLKEIFRIKKPNIELTIAMTGQQGLEQIRINKPDLILLDLDLPDMHGSEILEITRENKSTAEIPVIVVSADATKNQVERLFSIGANEYITKPFDVAELLNTIDNHLKKTK